MRCIVLATSTLCPGLVVCAGDEMNNPVAGLNEFRVPTDMVPKSWGWPPQADRFPSDIKTALPSSVLREKRRRSGSCNCPIAVCGSPTASTLLSLSVKLPTPTPKKLMPYQLIATDYQCRLVTIIANMVDFTTTKPPGTPACPMPVSCSTQRFTAALVFSMQISYRNRF
jgi:hypothetical protein